MTARVSPHCTQRNYGPMKITNVEKLTNERWLNLYAATFEHKGHTGQWVFASRREPYTGHSAEAVIIAPVLRNPGEPPRLVMVREYRVPIGGYSYALPAGLIDPGESAEQTIRREVREETGFEVSAIHRVTQPLFSSSGLTDEAASIAFIDVQGQPNSTQALEAGEDIEVVLLDHEGICRLCDDKSVLIDAKAWTVLYLYRQLGKLE
jgi:ADP-ribose diphosphatase